MIGPEFFLVQDIGDGERRIEAEHQTEQPACIHIYDDVRIANEQPCGHWAYSVSSEIP
jgi:hypothetical protein